MWAAIFVFFVGGFLVYESSGLLGRTVTTGTAVASVNGHDISYLAWQNVARGLEQEQEQRAGRALTLDERSRIETQALDQLVTDVLLEQEYQRRHIRVTDDEIIQAADYSPPPQVAQSPEFQTDGQFDLAKWQRYLHSAAARQSGINVQLESYYRSEIPKQKLFEQVANDVYVSDERLWSVWRDTHDSAQMTYAGLRAETISDSAVKVADGEIRAYYEKHRTELERPGRAVVSVVSIPRTVTASDSAAVRSHLLALRDEIASGKSKFEDVARRESSDSASAVDGGRLPAGPRGRFVAPFEQAAYALKPGELSQPVLTPFGYHLIRVDSLKGDTISLHHILLKIQQSDSAATRTDRRADSLSKFTASVDQPAKFDSAARRLQLLVTQAVALEGEPLTVNGRYVPSVSAWAFGGAKVGESSELFDSDEGYYLARLDSLVPGGVPTVEAVRDEIRREIARQKKLDALMLPGQQLAAAAAASTLEAAAQARGLAAVKSPMFARVSSVPELGQFSQPIGAAFTLPVGAVSAPIKATNGVYVIRVDRRINADRAAWEAQKRQQREQITQALRQQRVRDYLENLRKQANVKDNRKELNTSARQTTS